MSDPASARPGKILVMDDDKMLLATARLMLQRLGFDALLAEDSRQALDLYLEHLQTDYPVDVAILDLQMSREQGGVVTAGRILEAHPAARLVLASDSTNHEVMVNFREHGFSACIAKPFVLAQLGAVLGELLE
jgi:two-component system phosphate regulon response regulator OmpR